MNQEAIRICRAEYQKWKSASVVRNREYGGAVYQIAIQKTRLIDRYGFFHSKIEAEEALEAIIKP